MSLNIAITGQLAHFSGALNRDTLMLYSPWPQLNTLSGEVTFDFSSLTNVDSAGLAWLIQQLALAKQQGLTIRIQQAPEQLQSLARVSAVTAFLPIID
ncbi:STAS domain-containing protein [Arsukibacterium sp.]|uniref:STAS domain-containing protein n=1 Tax=Arsukibacterium sp. TaxID=1977258 RepID=UPI002FD912C8